MWKMHGETRCVNAPLDCPEYKTRESVPTLVSVPKHETEQQSLRKYA